jgi:hypothetical protein
MPSATIAVGHNRNGCHGRWPRRECDAQYRECVTTLDNFATGLATNCLPSNGSTEKEQTTQECKIDLHTKLQTSTALSHREFWNSQLAKLSIALIEGVG